MITTFEDITQNLTPEQMTVIDNVIGVLNKIEKPMLSHNVMILVNKNLEDSLTPIAFRKIVNYIRSNSLLPIIATSKGYFVSYDAKVIGKQIISLTDRAQAIANSAKGLIKFYENCNNSIRK